MARRPPTTSRPARYEIDEPVPPHAAEPPPQYGTVPATSISATDAARGFSELINRACYQGETFIIERGGRALCKLGPIESRRCTGKDLLALLARLPRPDGAFLDAVEAAARTQAPVEISPWEK